MSGIKSSMGTAAVHGSVDRMKANGRLDTQRLYTQTLRYQDEPRFPTMLGLELFDRGEIVSAVFSLREARRRVMLEAETHPNNEEILEDLRLIELDLAEAEAALSV